MGQFLPPACPRAVTSHSYAQMTTIDLGRRLPGPEYRAQEGGGWSPIVMVFHRVIKRRFYAKTKIMRLDVRQGKK